jgi:CheY-like chemotaxis protein
MNLSGLIIVIDDDGEEALHFLKSSFDYPCIILCDINMPKITGFELRRTINSNHALRERSVLFIFYSTVANIRQVREAYDITVQGFFIKGSSLEEADSMSLNRAD